MTPLKPYASCMHACTRYSDSPEGETCSISGQFAPPSSADVESSWRPDLERLPPPPKPGPRLQRERLLRPVGGPSFPLKAIAHFFLLRSRNFGKTATSSLKAFENDSRQCALSSPAFRVSDLRRAQTSTRVRFPSGQ